MPPKSSRRVPANTRETRSTLNLKATTANAIIKKYENAAQSRLHKLAPELMGMILELVLVEVVHAVLELQSLAGEPVDGAGNELLLDVLTELVVKLELLLDVLVNLLVVV